MNDDFVGLAVRLGRIKVVKKMDYAHSKVEYTSTASTARQHIPRIQASGETMEVDAGQDEPAKSTRIPSTIPRYVMSNS